MKRTNGASTRISTNDLRFSFHRVLKAVRGGRTLTLTYRNKELARIVPIKSSAQPASDDWLFRLAELAEPMGKLSNQQIDALIYGR